MSKKKIRKPFGFHVEDEDFNTSSYTSRGGIITRCVKVAIKKEGVALRDSKDPTNRTLFFNPEEWDAFLKGVKDGEFG